MGECLVWDNSSRQIISQAKSEHFQDTQQCCWWLYPRVVQSMTNIAWSRSNIAHLIQLAKAPRIAEVYLLVSGLQILFQDDSEGDRCCLHGGIRLEGWVIAPTSLCMHCLCHGGVEGPHSANKVEQHFNRQLLWRLLAAFAGSAGCSLPALVTLSVKILDLLNQITLHLHKALRYCCFAWYRGMLHKSPSSKARTRM